MVPQKQTTGYPPVTDTEERRDSETAPARFGKPSVRLSANEKIVTDAISAVIERNRAEIEVARLGAETRRHALDMLDRVFLDVLHALLNETSALEGHPRQRGVPR
jgi:hypothetical protein